jgi:hypothetical protein
LLGWTTLAVVVVVSVVVQWLIILSVCSSVCVLTDESVWSLKRNLFSRVCVWPRDDLPESSRQPPPPQPGGELGEAGAHAGDLLIYALLGISACNRIISCFHCTAHTYTRLCLLLVWTMNHLVK